MKKNIWIAAGIAGMFLCAPLTDTRAEVSVHVSAGDRPGFVIDRRPDFIELPGRGFSVSVGSPYDIVYYDNHYFLYNNGYWYRSSHYRGPWIGVRAGRLPYRLRAHRWEDIRRYRDIEYRRHEGRRGWDRRYDERRHDDRDRRYDERRHDDRDRRFDERR